MPEYALHHLDISNAEEIQLVHRDYIAHTLRWTHLARFFTGDNIQSHVVDLGCGPQMPLARMLYTNRRKVLSYTAVDLRKTEPLKENFTYFPMHIVQADVTEDVTYGAIKSWLQAQFNVEYPSVIVTLETLEHMFKGKGQKFIEQIYNLAGPDTIVFLSTPCHDGSLPADHNYEWRHEELKEELQKRFQIVANYGTFASQKDIKPVLTAAEREVYNGLVRYYDPSYLATIFAPMHPAQSRNNMWVMKKKEVVDE